MKLIVVYTKSSCPYCTTAKELLKAKGFPFEEKNAEENMEEFFALAEKHNHRTVPMIFIGDQFIGGYTDLKEKEDAGELNKIINE
jgi:glutaredoxin 3